MTRPCRGATLIGNCLQALAAIDAIGDDFAMKTGICGKGGQKAPVGTGQGHVRLEAMTVGGTELWAHPCERRSTVGTRAVEAALAAGASEAEAYATEASEREVRAHGGEVESLTAATQRGLGIRAWVGDRVGYAYGTDLADAGFAALAARAAEAARAADGDEFAGPPAPGGAAPEMELSDPSIGEWSMGAPRRAGARRRARGARCRPAGRRRRDGRLRRLRRSGRDLLLDRDLRRVRVLHLLRLHAGAGRRRQRRRDRPRLRPRPRPGGPRPRRRRP